VPKDKVIEDYLRSNDNILTAYENKGVMPENKGVMS
jgi:hypothetical protein